MIGFTANGSLDTVATHRTLNVDAMHLPYAEELEKERFNAQATSYSQSCNTGGNFDFWCFSVSAARFRKGKYRSGYADAIDG